MHPHNPPSERFARFAQDIARSLSLCAFGVVSLTASAQLIQQVSMPQLQGVANSGAADAGQAAIATTVLPGLGGNQAVQAIQPILAVRPDAGATDAQLQPVQAQRTRKPQIPSQFQRFVQESTGRLLPHFGADLFDNPQTYAADATAPAPSDYLLGQGDEVRIQLWGSVDYSGTHTIDRNGQISLPKIGTIKLSGL